MAQVIVTFLKPYKHYNEGEQAGFDQALADKLVAAKVVAVYEPDNKAAKPSTKTTASKTAKDAPVDTSTSEGDAQPTAGDTAAEEV